MADETPIVFLAGNSSGREWLESLLGCESWRPEHSNFAQEFLDHPRILILRTASCFRFLTGFIMGHGDAPMTAPANRKNASSRPQVFPPAS